jgi:hypothetical protein
VSTTENPLLQAALDYAERGWHIFPADPATKGPLVDNGFYDASIDPAVITAWWTEWPCAMIGMRCGPESGVWLLDLDVDDGKGINGVEQFFDLAAGRLLPETIKSKTPRGGVHLLFKWADGVKNSAGELGPGIDTKGEGGCCILPPSQRSDGRHYETLCNVYPDPPEAPSWLLELVLAQPKKETAQRVEPSPRPRTTNGGGNAYARAALAAEADRVASAAVGQRNAALNTAAFSLGQLVASGVLDENAVRARLTDAAAGLAKDDGADSVEKTISSGLAAGLQQPRQIPERREQQPRAKEDEQPLPTISATPFVWRDPTTIAPRAWLYGRHYIRKFLACTVAHGGIGKTSLIIVEALAMAAGRALLGITPTERARVWLWNGEDPADEVDRRIMAAMLQHNVTPQEIEGYLFKDTGRETPIILATQTRSGTVIARPVIDALIEEIKRKQINVLIIDPFVKSHKVSENDNVAIDAVATQWAEIADATNCAIELLHHPRKTGGAEITVEDSRGAVALIDASRSARVLNKMSQKEAEDAGIEKATAWRYLRLDDGKANMAPPPERADWYKLESIALGNGDNVGAVTTWTWPDPFEGITVHHLRAAQKEASEGGPWRANVQAKNWIGLPIAKVLKLNVHDEKDRKKVRALLATWIKTGMFVEVSGKDEQRHPRQYIEVGTWAD